ncbi:MAG: hypothetical protein U5K51_09255 [Flavobacteriaceae bacterium]|nr:hypothetical protein [Flavobacteriaceae bacterium]
MNNEVLLNERGQALFELLKNARYFGLEPWYYSFSRLDTLLTGLRLENSIEEKLAKAALHWRDCLLKSIFFWENI